MRLPTPVDEPVTKPAEPADASPSLFVVAKTVGGFAREDAPQASVIGVFTCQATADRVALLTQARCFPVDLDHVSPSLLQTAQEIGVDLPVPAPGRRSSGPR